MLTEKSIITLITSTQEILYKRMRLEKYSHITYLEYSLRSFISQVPYLFLPLDKDRHHYHSCCSTLVSNYLINAGVIGQEALFPWDFANNLSVKNGFMYSGMVRIAPHS